MHENTKDPNRVSFLIGILAFSLPLCSIKSLVRHANSLLSFLCELIITKYSHTKLKHL